ncbi:50S ribosomal protein L25/general stress protein Ctc [soil metagenome]
MAEKKVHKEISNKIVAEQRTSFGKGFARRLRAEGRIPAVVYGHGTEPQHLSLPGHEVGLLLRKANAILDLQIGADSQLALVKDVQRDPVRQIIEHIDLVIIRKGEKVTVDVPIHLEGESFSGTTVNQDANTLSIEALATSIPERIVIDIEGKENGYTLYAKDVVLPEGASLITDGDVLVVAVTDAAAVDLGESDETPAEGETASESEAEAAE